MKHTFSIPLLPPSVNILYGYNPVTKQRYLTNKGREFKTTCKLFIPSSIVLDSSTKYKIHVNFYGNWYYKNGKIKRHDGQNLQKVLYDAIFERLGVDDSHLWEWSGCKVQSEEERTEVTLEALESIETIKGVRKLVEGVKTAPASCKQAKTGCSAPLQEIPCSETTTVKTSSS